MQGASVWNLSLPLVGAALAHPRGGRNKAAASGVREGGGNRAVRIHGEKNDQARLENGKLVSVPAQATCYLSCNIIKVVPVFHFGEDFVALEEVAARDAYVQ